MYRISHLPIRYQVTRSISTASPSLFGSAGGATVVVSGVGFDEDDYSVAIGGEACVETTFVSNGEITCVAPALSTGSREYIDRDELIWKFLLHRTDEITF